MSSNLSRKARFLIDVNLPRYFPRWTGAEYIHVADLNDEWSDTEIWHYAKTHRLTIVTKDADFSDRILLHSPPPSVIHIRLGNLKMRPFHEKIFALWPRIVNLSQKHKLVRVFADRLEAVR